MTINQALKKYSDARQIRISHELGASKNGIEDFVTYKIGDVKVLDVKLGKYESVVIFSAQAFEDDYYKKENEAFAQKSTEFFTRAIERIEAEKMPKEKTKVFSITTLDPAIKIGAKVEEVASGCIAEIVEIDEYEGIKVKVLNRGEPHVEFFAHRLEKNIEKGTHKIIE